MHHNKTQKKTQQQIRDDIRKNATRNSYDKTTDAYIANTASLHPEKYGKKFTRLLPKKGRILDLGCGPGSDAKVFADQGYEVVGIDFSPAMIEAARAYAPQVEFHMMDIESLNFPNAFDGVWANCSLLHVPKRSIPTVLQNIAALLRPKGIFYLALKLGDNGESLEKDSRYNGVEKFWSYFKQEELAGLLADAGFTVLEQEIVQPTMSYDTHPNIKILASKG